MLRGIVVVIGVLSMGLLTFSVMSFFENGRRKVVEGLIRVWFPKYHMVRIRKRTYGPAAQAAEAFRQMGEAMTGGMGDETHADQAD